MKLIKPIAFFIALMSMMPAEAQSGIDNPITKAVLQVYEQQLRENPSDYITRLRRAYEYYQHDEYLRALDDVNQAIKATPASESDVLLQEYMLRAGIYNQTRKKEQALADLNVAYDIDPTSMQVINERANTEFDLGMYGDAKADYQRLRRLNSRNSQALLGLARVAIKENNYGLANEYLEEAVNLDPNNAEIYVRRASVRKQMGDHNNAVDDLLLAISSDSKNNKAIEALVEYGNTNYVATMNGLTNAIRQAPNVGMFRYLRAVIAQAHYHYGAAIDDFNYIIDNNLYKYHGLHASIAECQYALGRFDEALSSIDYALGMIKDDARYFCLKAKILRALKRDDEAVNAAAQSLAVDRNYADGLVEMGLCYMAKENYKEAASLFGEAVMTDAENPYYYMVRAWLLNDYMNQPAAARTFYEQVADMDHFYIDNVRSLKGFAQLYIDRVTQAEAWMNNILTTVDDYDGFINYYGACFYAMTGDNDRALVCAEKSLKAGYANYYNWMYNTDARINVAPLRDDLRFLNLLNRYDMIFKNN